mmetsp:Transcript_30214/g.97422  ORF Transcript_30214/g.97422 Transcript_30214/m.97422 type:complete len:200 (-) Transcript_30214:677-1276(-)
MPRAQGGHRAAQGGAGAVAAGEAQGGAAREAAPGGRAQAGRGPPPGAGGVGAPRGAPREDAIGARVAGSQGSHEISRRGRRRGRADVHGRGEEEAVDRGDQGAGRQAEARRGAAPRRAGEAPRLRDAGATARGAPRPRSALRRALREGRGGLRGGLRPGTDDRRAGPRRQARREAPPRQGPAAPRGLRSGRRRRQEGRL